jgi:ankyrin repeat protein
VKQVLQTLPPTLDDTYTRMLTRIKELYHQEALTLLRWLAYARSPPTLGELVDAAITDPVEESFIDTSERGGLRDALNILAGLVTIEESQVADTKNSTTAGFVTNDTLAAGDSQGADTFNNQHLTTDNRIRLAHFSVKEYLESERLLGSKADRFRLESTIGHQTLANSCITYLRYYSTSPEKTLTKRDLETFPLLNYAARSWFYHYALQPNMETSRAVSFLQTERAKDDWLIVHNPDTPWREPFSTYRPKRQVHGSAIYYASLLGLSAVVHSLLANGAHVNAQGGVYCSAVLAAGAVGHTSVVQLLVDAGADVNAQGGDHSRTVQAAAAGGYTEIVRLLIDSGAGVNTQGGEYGSALQAAAAGGYTEIVRLLVNSGADVNAQGGDYGSAVLAASFKGNRGIVQLLVDSGANVDAQGEDYGSTLQAAAAGGHTEIVQLLVDLGVDVNVQGGRYGSAVQAAAAGGHTEVVQLLVDLGADVNVQGGDYGSAILVASC